MEEIVKDTDENLNITLGSFTIETTFSLAESYLLRFIYGDKDYETGYFDLTLSEQSPYANNTPIHRVPPLLPFSRLPSRVAQSCLQ
jgi:hypothetical protein